LSLKRKPEHSSLFGLLKKNLTRQMTCRFGVVKHLKGGESNLDDNKFFTVFDCVNKDYRAINKETIFKLKTGGIVYGTE